MSLDIKHSNKKWLFLIIPVIIVAFDLISKYFIMQEPRPYMKEIIGNFYRHTFVYNEGITFGMLNNIDSKWMPYILTLLGLIALGIIVYLFLNIHKYVRKGNPRIWGQVALMLIIGGALGNMIDRMFLFNDPSIPNHHAVVDFIDVGIGDVRWYIFNIADSSTVVGSIILAVLFLFFEKKDSKKEIANTDNEDKSTATTPNLS